MHISIRSCNILTIFEDNTLGSSAVKKRLYEFVELIQDFSNTSGTIRTFGWLFLAQWPFDRIQFKLSRKF